ncbi:hypothetical protein [Polyangium aurulentum]|uniref:hypothetical protein n=1 Tax=Polyangium aurulentum TaxID=2567896 RepID=UPI0010AE5328|nr:hypothetical protein [Polyangium aurulentum]UQA56444.1 hypothetical protein E8A73_034790 [Polyangium aurulentum]
MTKTKKIIAGVALLLAGAGAAVVAWIGPRNVIGMARYDQRTEGRLAVGDAAPDVELLAIGGERREKISGYIGDRPLVLVFGSFT